MQDSGSTNPRRLTDGPRDEFSPSRFAGRLIACMSDHETHPVWAPDGRHTFLRHGERGPVVIRVADPVRGGYDLPVDAVFVYRWATPRA